MKEKSKEHYILIFFAILIVVIVFGKDIPNITGFAVFQNDFTKNLEELNEINKKYNSNIYKFPSSIEEDELLLEELNNIKDNFDKKTSEPSELLFDFRIKLVESDVFFKEGWKYGRGSSLKYGFGCRKGLPRLRDATFNRNMSSQIGYEAVTIMNKLIEKYPKQAEIANVTYKNLLFLNASFYQEEKNSNRDRRIIERACVKNKDN